MSVCFNGRCFTTKLLLESRNGTTPDFAPSFTLPMRHSVTASLFHPVSIMLTDRGDLLLACHYLSYPQRGSALFSNDETHLPGTQRPGLFFAACRTIRPRTNAPRSSPHVHGNLTTHWINIIVRQDQQDYSIIECPNNAHHRIFLLPPKSSFFLLWPKLHLLCNLVVASRLPWNGFGRILWILINIYSWRNAQSMLKQPLDVHIISV